MDTTPNFVPENTEGKPLDIEFTVTELELTAALATYKRACKRLLNPAIWKQLSGVLSPEFVLITPANEAATRLMEEGDFIRIDILGPGSIAGGGYDWVKAELIQENILPAVDESFGITLRASKNPAKPEDVAAHFFKDHATSTFIIERTGLKINASYFGRNEVPNTDNVSLADKLRNGIVAVGAIKGISNLQWSALTKGLLAVEIGGE